MRPRDRVNAMTMACYHLPGLFEFYELYRTFLPLFRTHREYFYDWCEIGSIYGAPADCLWGGGRVGFGEARPEEVAALTRDFGRNTFGIESAMPCATCLKTAARSQTA